MTAKYRRLWGPALKVLRIPAKPALEEPSLIAQTPRYLGP
jgi:hypothetical protein